MTCSDQLLHDEHRDDWRLWFEAQGISNVDRNAGVVFTDSNADVDAPWWPRK